MIFVDFWVLMFRGEVFEYLKCDKEGKREISLEAALGVVRGLGQPRKKDRFGGRGPLWALSQKKPRRPFSLSRQQHHMGESLEKWEIDDDGERWEWTTLASWGSRFSTRKQKRGGR